MRAGGSRGLGQGNYAAVNARSDALAERRHAEGAAVISVARGRRGEAGFGLGGASGAASGPGACVAGGPVRAFSACALR
ncbi:KR domain-containing protein [Streptomyces sp. NPDC091209]|uniref:KR domain-containing protein n=1 Tax=Streptomyces sp. NPDC091209 TaxID=3365974 RepID=UPI0037FC211B